MSNEDRTYSAEFKTKVAKEALDKGKKNLDRLSDKFDVPISTILTWTAQLEKNAEENFEADEDSATVDEYIDDEERIDVQVDDEEIAASIEHGVMFDKVDNRKLISWSILGMVLVVLFVIALREMYQFNRLVSDDAALGSTEYYEVNQQKRQAEETLNNFGVVDLENGIYRIPIDSVINEMAEEQ